MTVQPSLIGPRRNTTEKATMKPVRNTRIPLMSTPGKHTKLQRQLIRNPKTKSSWG